MEPSSVTAAPPLDDERLILLLTGLENVRRDIAQVAADAREMRFLLHELYRERAA